MSLSHLDQISITPLLKTRLKLMLQEERVPHFLLFHAPKEEAASALAQSFLYEWLKIPSLEKQHPDYVVLEPEGKLLLHTIDNVHSFLKELALEPYQGKRRGVLIRHIDKMLPSSSNALLKALEEAPLSTVIIGTTAQPHRLLSTIRSRAHEVCVHLDGASQETEAVLKAVDLVKTRFPTPSFTELFALCEELEELLEEEPSQCALDALQAISSYVLEQTPSPQKRAALRLLELASSALEKNVSIKDSFLLFLMQR